MKRARQLEAEATPIDALNVSMAWLDLGSRWIEQWFAWQQAIWQPLVDQQARWIESWPNLCAEPFTARGAEQLA
jgi:hypothetical protein